MIFIRIRESVFWENLLFFILIFLRKKRDKCIRRKVFILVERDRVWRFMLFFY